MDWLNGIGSVASVVGLFATFYTLHKVTNLSSALKQQSRDKQLSNLIDEIISISQTKRVIANSTARKVETLVKTVRLYDVSIVPFRHRKLKSLLTALETELSGQRQLSVIQLQLGLIRDEITIR